MNLLTFFKPNFSNFIVEKINNIKILNIYNNNYKQTFKKNINNFFLDKFKFNLFNNFTIKSLNEIKDNVKIIDRIFEGNNNIINSNILAYSRVGVLSYIKCNKNIYYNFNYNKVCKVKCNNIINFYKLGLVLFPLTFTSFYNYSNYIYSIYKYINSKSFNSYKSCLISLFYYYNGLLSSLICLYSHDDIRVLNSNISVIIAKLSSFVIFNNSLYNNLIPNFIISIKLMNIINNSFYLCNINICGYSPYLIGLTKYTLINSGIFSKLSFQETLKTLKTLVLNNKIDWNVDSKSNIILSSFIPSGSGWYRYFIN